MGTDDILSLETSLDGEYAILIKNLSRETEQEKTKKNKWSEIRAVMIEAKQQFTRLFKYDLVVPWQYVDIGREVNKVKLIILSKISCNIHWFMFKRLDYFVTHTNNKPRLRCAKLYTMKITF